MKLDIVPVSLAEANAFVEANLPEWCRKNISSMHELNNQIAV